MTTPGSSGIQVGQTGQYKLGPAVDFLETAELLAATGLMSDTDVPEYLRIQTTRLQQGCEMYAVGARDQNDSLIGYGRLGVEGTWGIMGDFGVHPDARHQGIGRAIVRQRVEIAQQIGLVHLLADLEPTNTLGSYYAELGFKYTPSTGLHELRLNAGNIITHLVRTIRGRNVTATQQADAWRIR